MRCTLSQLCQWQIEGALARVEHLNVDSAQEGRWAAYCQFNDQCK